MKDKCTSLLLNGVVIPHNGNYYSNANLTDDIARAYLHAFPTRAELFDVLPPEREKKPKAVAKPKAGAKAKTTKPQTEEPQTNPETKE